MLVSCGFYVSIILKGVEMMLRFPIGKNLLTKFFVFFMVLLMVLPLAGCFENGSSLKEGFIKNAEVKSCRSMGTLSVTNNVPGEQLDPGALAVFSLLEKGLTMEADMADTTSMKMIFTPGDADLLRDMGWIYPQDPFLELFTCEGKIAIKTSADPAYLVLDPTEAGLLAPGVNSGFSAVFDVGSIQEKQVEKVQEFIRLFIKDFDFSFSRVEPSETVKLELPDGIIEARKIKVELDFEEILDLFTYTLEYMAESKAFEDYMRVSIREPLEQMMDAGTIPPEELPSKEEMEELVETVYQQIQNVFSEAVDYMHTVSPGVLKKQFGLDLAAEEEYYLDGEGYIRKTRSTYQIKAEHEALQTYLGTSQLDLTVSSEQVLWDINKPVAVAFPPTKEQVSLFAMMGDPALQEEMGEGPLFQLINLMGAGPEHLDSPAIPANLVLDLENNRYLLNGKPIELAPAPYMEGQSVMVPFRTLAELAGGEIHWIPETSRVIYEDDKMKIEFASGSKTALVNGVETDLAGTAIIKDGRFMVPAGLVGQLVQHYAVQDETNVVIFVF